MGNISHVLWLSTMGLHAMQAWTGVWLHDAELMIVDKSWIIHADG